MQTAKFSGGRWYYVITIASMGLLACVPFFHAASKLKRGSLWKLGGVYALFAVVAFTIFGNAPVDETDTPVGAAADLSMLAIIGLVISACLRQRQLRREIHGLAESAIAAPQHHDSIARIENARKRREQARRLATSDPLMARELRIGRPDLQGNYDDGGLIDLNSAPAPVIAAACDISPQLAEDITEARASLGEFSSVEEALVYAHVGGGAAEVIRDRALVLPAVPR